MESKVDPWWNAKKMQTSNWQWAEMVYLSFSLGFLGPVRQEIEFNVRIRDIARILKRQIPGIEIRISDRDSGLPCWRLFYYSRDFVDDNNQTLTRDAIPKCQLHATQASFSARSDNKDSLTETDHRQLAIRKNRQNKRGGGVEISQNGVYWNC